jgi:2'-hydroxyisoflavone reductase
VAEDFLLAQKVEPWSALPLWLPSTDPEHHAHSRVDIQRAEHTRLVTRPLEQTVAAVMDEGLPPEGDPRRRGKLTRARETELLALWHARPAETEAP